MKKILIFASLIMTVFFAGVSVYADNGWSIDNSGKGRAEICACNSLCGKALHVENTDSDDIIISHLIGATGTVRRNYRVTFYMSGEYDEEKIMVGTGTKTTGSNPDVITYMSLSHEKVQKSDSENGWMKYSYIFRGNIANNSEFKFVFGNGAGTVYVDNVSIIFDSATDGEFVPTGHGILADGEFEDEITTESGFDIEDYGWKINEPTTAGVAMADNTINPVARVVEDADGNRMLYAKYNSNAWANDGLILTKTIGKTGWESFYVTFKVKGAFNPNSIMVGSKYDDKLIRLVGGDGCSEENPYGSSVVAEALEDGWTKYTVKTYGEGTEFRIKIHSQALEMYFDDFEVVTASGNEIEVKNSGFEEIDFNADKIFAQGWTAENITDKSFAQREKASGSYAIFLVSESVDNKAGFYQTIENITIGERYTVTFEARSSFESSGLKVGFAEAVTALNGECFSGIASEVNTYSFMAEAHSDKLIFVTDGICEGVWIDNVSVMDSEGNELVINGDFEIKTQPPVYTAENIKLLKEGIETQIGQGIYTVTAMVENNFGQEDMEFTMIISHDRNGEMIKYKEYRIILDPNGEDIEPTQFGGDIDLSDYAEGDTLEVYIWDNDTAMNSLTPYVHFN